VETEWLAVNNGVVYTDRVQGDFPGSLLQYYSSKHASSASADEWRSCIREGAVSVNGEVVDDPEATLK
jgi:hypothetical protein